MSGEAIIAGVETVKDLAVSTLDIFNTAPLNYAVYAGLFVIAVGLVARFIPRKRK